MLVGDTCINSIQYNESYMVRNKNRIVPPVNTGTALSCDDRKKFAEFVTMLVKVNECIKVSDYSNEDNKKTVKKVKQKGSLKCGPYLIEGFSFIDNWTIFVAAFKHLYTQQLSSHDRYRRIISST